MAQVSTTVRLPGWEEEWTVHHLRLNQTYNDHHTFELSVRLPENYRLTLAALQRVLGEQADITIALCERPGAACRFVGFVDQVAPEWTRHGRSLRVVGYSPSLLLDTLPRFRTFAGQSLGSVAEHILAAYSGLPFSKNKVADTVDFAVQMQETDYRFLCRMADACGKLFYYDGEKMQLGEFPGLTGPGAPLAFGKVVDQAGLSLNLTPLSFRLSGYDLESSKQHMRTGEQEPNGHPAAAATAQKSGKYPLGTVQLTHLVKGDTELTAAARRLAARQAYELVRLQGASNDPSLRIGKKVNFSGARDILGQGDYLILDITHTVGPDGAYHNTFTAAPAGFPYPVRMQTAQTPLAGPLMAVVKETNDPHKLGRVRVQFIGDERQSLSPWLRVLTPYTGHGGQYFLPEIGDQVVVLAEDFNVEKQPFVAGAFYHGNAPATRWHDPHNRKKGLATKKISFLLDDNTGKLTIEAEEIELKASKKMNLKGGRHLTQEADRIDLNP